VDRLMANEQRGETTITLGGETYTLRPTFEALAEMEQKAGCGIIVLMRRFLKDHQGGTFDFSTRDVTAVLSSAIKAGGTQVPANLGAMIREAGLIFVANAVANFLANALAGEQQGNAEAAPENP
jgi:hypothetical protein